MSGVECHSLGEWGGGKHMNFWHLMVVLGEGQTYAEKCKECRYLREFFYSGKTEKKSCFWRLFVHELLSASYFLRLRLTKCESGRGEGTLASMTHARSTCTR